MDETDGRKKKKKKRTILRRLVFDPIERLPPFIFFNRRSTGSLPLGEKEKKKEKKEKKGKEKEEKKKILVKYFIR